MRFLPLLVLALVLLGAGPALASTVEVVDGALTYTAARGERNALTLTTDGVAITLADPGASGLRIGPGCTPAGPLKTASCPAAEVRRTVIATADDRDVVSMALALPTEIDAGSGRDEVTVGSAGGFATGGPGDDRLFGAAGSDVLVGAEGDDTVRGGVGDDRLFGGPGADELEGEAGADVVAGQDGRDLLTGGAGVDALDGGAGADSVDGGADSDRLLGGTGDDVVNAADQAPDEVGCGTGQDSGRADGVDRLTPDCEALEVEATGPQVVRTMLPYPIIRIVGEVSGSRTRVRRLQARVPSGTTVHVFCRGRGCPFRTRSYTTDRAQTLTISALEHRYGAGSVIEVFVTAPERIGKYTRFVARRGKAPRRTDRCVRGDRLRAVRCQQA